RHTRFSRDWSSDVCSSDLYEPDRLESIDVSILSGRFSYGYSEKIPRYFIAVYCVGDFVGDIPVVEVQRVSVDAYGVLVVLLDIRSEERRVGRSGVWGGGR